MKRASSKINIWLALLIPVLFIGLKSDKLVTQEDGINFSHVSYKEALELAKKEKKMVFIDCYTTWCGPCKLMSRTVFKQKDVGDYYNKNFINLKIDMETAEGMFIGKKYAVSAYPTYLYLKADGTLIKKAMGATKGETFIQFGKDAVANQ